MMLPAEAPHRLLPPLFGAFAYKMRWCAAPHARRRARVTASRQQAMVGYARMSRVALICMPIRRCDRLAEPQGVSEGVL